MDVASIELCEELHRLSSWKSSTPGFSHDGGSIVFSWAEGDTPAYQLGYLFTRLSEVTTVAVEYVNPKNPTATDLKEWYGRYIAYTPEMRQMDYPVSNSPADAVCKLAIRLFKRGVLTT